MDSATDITQLISAAEQGDLIARDRLYAALYSELTRLSRAHLSRTGTTSLDPPRLVHEAYLRLNARGASGSPHSFPNRKAFFGYASNIMRSVIIDYVRERQAAKRGSGMAEVTLNTRIIDEVGAALGAEALNDALIALEKVDPRCLRVVEMRYFGGLTEDEVAELLNVSVPTVKRDWRKARAFLFEQLR